MVFYLKKIKSHCNYPGLDDLVDKSANTKMGTISSDDPNYF